MWLLWHFTPNSPWSSLGLKMVGRSPVSHDHHMTCPILSPVQAQSVCGTRAPTASRPPSTMGWSGCGRLPPCGVPMTSPLVTTKAVLLSKLAHHYI